MANAYRAPQPDVLGKGGNIVPKVRPRVRWSRFFAAAVSAEIDGVHMAPWKPSDHLIPATGVEASGVRQEDGRAFAFLFEVQRFRCRSRGHCAVSRVECYGPVASRAAVAVTMRDQMTRELLNKLRDTPTQAARLVAEASEASLDRKTGDGWSARVILAHLRDIEYLEMRMLLERILGEDVPELHFLDAEQWQVTRNKTRDDKKQLLGDFALQRQATMNILDALRAKDWTRKGTMAGDDGSTITVRELVEGWLDHDEGHIAQMEEALGTTVDDFHARWRTSNN